MISESFIAKKLTELEKLDINDPKIGYKLQKFYGILEVLEAETYEECIKLCGIYKQFDVKYRELSKKHSDKLMEQFKKDKVICDSILRSMHAN